MTKQTDLTVMIRVEGKPFRCDCGCNVFRKRAATQYSCNACDNWYVAEAEKRSVSYESWRISHQSSEQAARAAYAEVKRLRAALATAERERDELSEENTDLRVRIRALEGAVTGKKIVGSELKDRAENGWWCAICVTTVEGKDVTYEEAHTRCGFPVVPYMKRT